VSAEETAAVSTHHQLAGLPSLRQFAVQCLPEENIMPAVSTARLEARISPELQQLLKRAAEIEGRTLTDFVVSAVQEAAQKTIEQAEVIRLSLQDQQRFAEALLAPPSPSPALKRAMARHDKLLRTEE